MTPIDSENILNIRRNIYRLGINGRMAHLASSFSCVEILYALFMKNILKYKINEPTWKDRDRFVLSKGHAGLALYCTMAAAGLVNESVINTYLQPGSHIGGEPSMRDLPGIEASTGSLGHGLAMAVGMALGQKMDHSQGKTYVVIGDGECEEGVIWEAAASATAFELNNLILIMDNNKIQKMDQTKNIIGNPNWEEKWKSFGWEVLSADGHDVEELIAKLQIPEGNKPRIIIADTIKGKGVSIMENNPNWHFKIPNKKERKIFEKDLHLGGENAECIHQ